MINFVTDKYGFRKCAVCQGMILAGEPFADYRAEGRYENICKRCAEVMEKVVKEKRANSPSAVSNKVIKKRREVENAEREESKRES